MAVPSTLRALARTYRVFSELDGGAEFERYGGSIPIARLEWLQALQEPPSTTTQVNLCIVKPDTLAAGCSYAEMIRRRADAADTADADAEATAAAEDLVGTPTLFLSHAWRYSFAAVVDALLAFLEGLPQEQRAAARVWNDIFVEDQNSSDAKPKVCARPARLRVTGRFRAARAGVRRVPCPPAAGPWLAWGGRGGVVAAAATHASRRGG